MGLATNNNAQSGGGNWGQAASAAITSSAGIAAQSAAGKKTFKRNKEMMDIQFKNQKELNRQGQQLGIDTWNATSYPAQVEKTN